MTLPSNNITLELYGLSGCVTHAPHPSDKQVRGKKYYVQMDQWTDNDIPGVGNKTRYSAMQNLHVFRKSFIL